MKITERLREPSKYKYREKCNEEKTRREYGSKRYQNMSKENKQTLKEYQKNYDKTKKST